MLRWECVGRIQRTMGGDQLRQYSMVQVSFLNNVNNFGGEDAS
jgi:hypothetical protein